MQLWQLFFNLHRASRCRFFVLPRFDPIRSDPIRCDPIQCSKSGKFQQNITVRMSSWLQVETTFRNSFGNISKLFSTHSTHTFCLEFAFKKLGTISCYYVNVSIESQKNDIRATPLNVALMLFCCLSKCFVLCKWFHSFFIQLLYGGFRIEQYA